MYDINIKKIINLLWKIKKMRLCYYAAWILQNKHKKNVFFNIQLY